MTGTILSLDEIKKHCRIDADFNDEDSLLEIYRDSAIKEFELSTNRLLYVNNNGSEPLPERALLLNYHIKAALLLLIAYWYENREMAVPYAQNSLLKEIPISFSCIAIHYRWWNV